MSEKTNCWEFKDCGREEGGAKAGELGVCPTFKNDTYDGDNGGKNGGRICWAAAGTFCGGEVRGIFVKDQDSCVECDFFIKVKKEAGARDFMLIHSTP